VSGFPTLFYKEVLRFWKVVLGGATMGAFGLVAAIIADKIDQVSAFQNFVIMPLTFLSGVFYSIHSLPGVWQTLSHLNPVFYMIDGFRFGFFGMSDVSPWVSLIAIFICLLLISLIALGLLEKGYKLRH
jgi:ABC-2 type transport system permease protein